MKRCFRSYML